MRAFAHRRIHLVLALTIFAASIARIVAQASGIGVLAPTAFRVCIGVALVLAAIVVTRASRMQHGFASIVAILSCLGGGCVGFVTEQTIYIDRPHAAISFQGVDLGGTGGAILGAVVGLLIGGIFAAFGAAARALHRRSPELACIAGWALAASASLATRSWLAIVPCAIGAAIQLAQIRRAAPARIATRPYR